MAEKEIIGIIDCGTNTFNLLVAELGKEKPVILHESKIAVKIGKGMPQSGRFDEGAMQRALDAISQHKQTAVSLGASQINAFATAAFRNAANGPELAEKIRIHTGIAVHIIPGSEEARLIYLGIKSSGVLDEATSLIMDIGGGSTELILGNVSEIFAAHSFDTGASKLLDEFCPNDPVRPEEILRIENYLHGLFDSFRFNLETSVPAGLIGSSGFFDTLADLAFYQFPGKYPPKQIISEVQVEDFYALYEMLVPLRLEERLKIRGLPEFRADMIVVSFILAKHIIELWNISRILSVKFSMKEGVLYEYRNGRSLS